MELSSAIRLGYCHCPDLKMEREKGIRAMVRETLKRERTMERHFECLNVL